MASCIRNIRTGYQNLLKLDHFSSTYDKKILVFFMLSVVRRLITIDKCKSKHVRSRMVLLLVLRAICRGQSADVKRNRQTSKSVKLKQ